MTVAHPHTPWRKLQLFARSPKGVMLWILLALGAAATPAEDARKALPTLLVAVAAAVAVDLLVTTIEQGRVAFPTSSLLTGFFVGLLMSPAEPAYSTATAAILAICSKHVLRTRRWTLFNPAALGLLLTALLFASGESWWGALPDLPLVFLPLVAVTGVVMVDKVNKWPQTLAFLATFYLLFTAASFVDTSPLVTEAFRVPYLNAAIFFAAFMLSDPPTSPARYGEQAVYGAAVALLSFAIQLAFHPQYFLLAGLLIGNAAFAWYRARPARRQSVARRAPMAAMR